MDREYKDNMGKVIFSGEENNGVRRLTVYTTPVAKARPRFTKNGHAYTPRKTAEYEDLLRTCWKLIHKKILTGALRLDIDFYVPIPKSWTKEQKRRAIEKETLPAQKPDIDNLIKAVLDGLNEVAFWDDKQIVSIVASEWYSVDPRVEIWIKEY